MNDTISVLLQVCPVLTIQRFLQAIHKGIVVWQPLLAGPDLLVCLNNSFKSNQ